MSGEAKQYYEQRIRDLEADRDGFERECNERAANIDRLREKADFWEREGQKAVDEAARLRATNTSLVDGAKRDSATIAELREDQERLWQDKERLWQKCRERGDELAKLREEVGHLRPERDALREEVEVYRNADVALRQMNEAIKADSEEAWNENKKLREESDIHFELCPGEDAIPARDAQDLIEQSNERLERALKAEAELDRAREQWDLAAKDAAKFALECARLREDYTEALKEERAEVDKLREELAETRRLWQLQTAEWHDLSIQHHEELANYRRQGCTCGERGLCAFCRRTRPW